MEGAPSALLLAALLSALPLPVLCMHLSAPVNLSMDSQHFVHLLRWEAGPGSPENVQYTVEVCWPSDEGKSCKIAPCSPVVEQSPLQCNLTEVFSDLQMTYYTFVNASRGNLTVGASFGAFEPFKDTVPEPPLLTVFPCNGSLCVQLQAPSERLLSIYNCTQVYPCFKYMLIISANSEFKFSKEVQGMKTVVLEHLVPGQQYCVNIAIKNRSSANRPPVCASTTKAESSMDVSIFVVVCMSIAGVCFMCFGALFSVFFLKTHLPFVLTSLQSPYKVQLMSCPTIESIHTISLGPDITKGIKRHKEEKEPAVDTEDDYQQDDRVAYERIGDQTRRCYMNSEMGSSSTPPSQDVQSETAYDKTHGPMNEIPTSPTHMPKWLYCTVSTEQTLKPPHRTKNGLQQKSAKPQAEKQNFPTGILSEELRNKDISFLRHKHKDTEDQDVGAESSINVNLFSLTLGGHMEEEQGETLELAIPRSLHRVQENATDIQPTCSPYSNKHVTNFEVKEEVESEKEEEEEEYDSGYMKRN